MFMNIYVKLGMNGILGPWQDVGGEETKTIVWY